MIQDHASSSHTCFSDIFLNLETPFPAIISFPFSCPGLGWAHPLSASIGLAAWKVLNTWSHSMWFLMLGYPHLVVFRFHLCWGMSQSHSTGWRISPYNISHKPRLVATDFSLFSLNLIIFFILLFKVNFLAQDMFDIYFQHRAVPLPSDHNFMRSQLWVLLEFPCVGWGGFVFYFVFLILLLRFESLTLNPCLCVCPS